MQTNSFLLSLFWVESLLDLLEDKQPDDSSMKFLGRPHEYADAFDNAQHFLHLRNPQPLSPPWAPHTKGQNFWTYYLRGDTNANVEGITAWQKLIPFLVSLPLRLTTGIPLFEPRFELFFYPHCISMAISLTWKPEVQMSLADANDIAFKMRRGSVYRLTWNGAGEDFYNNIQWPAVSDTPLSLDKLADIGLTIARTLAYGKKSKPGKLTSPTPFSVFTIMKGMDVDLSKAPESNGIIQKTLHALTTWQPIREGTAPLTFDERVSVGLGKEAGIADVLYGQPRGRAIWFPSRFTSNDPIVLNGLDCFHRNMVFCSLQTESLSALAQAIAVRHPTGDLPIYQRESARGASGNLGLLFGGHMDTYRSLSPSRQIEENNWKHDIDAMRARSGMTDLH